MRRARGLIALAALALLGGCAHGTPPQDASLAPNGTKLVAGKSRGVDCTTTYLVVATLSNCQPGGIDLLSPAGE